MKYLLTVLMLSLLLGCAGQEQDTQGASQENTQEQENAQGIAIQDTIQDTQVQ